MTSVILSEGLDMDSIVKVDQAVFAYEGFDTVFQALKGIDLSVEAGSHVAVLGANGSGKSTLAKLLNALELPQAGEVWVFDLNSKDESAMMRIRELCGMVFQNPDYQIIGTTVEEDLAFGPENLGLSPERIRRRIDEVARLVGIEDLKKVSPASLSGGQKQKLAIAGVLALHPKVIILDESTSMLDPKTRKEFMLLCEQLRQSFGLSFINITHHMEEVLLAEKVYVMNQGEIVLQGSPQDIFKQVELLKNLHLDVPVHTQSLYFLAQSLEKLLPDLEEKVKNIDDRRWQSFKKNIQQHLQEGESLVEKAKEKIMQLLMDWKDIKSGLTLEDLQIFKEKTDVFLNAQRSLVSLSRQDRELRLNRLKQAPTLLKVKDLCYRYDSFGEIQQTALDQISFSMQEGEILGIMGETGSGKSTLMQHLNGLLKIQKGDLTVFDKRPEKAKDIKYIRQHLALLFQYPEHQLFAETVEKDILYGVSTWGLSLAEQEERLNEAMQLVGLDLDLKTRSPFELSGGQKRRVALAGLLVMRPKILVLDEPAASLDPEGRHAMLELILKLNRQGVSIIMVSHSMEDLARVSDKILVLQKGKMLLWNESAKIFEQENLLNEARLAIPETLSFAKTLEKEVSVCGLASALKECLDVRSLLLHLLFGERSDLDAN